MKIKHEDRTINFVEQDGDVHGKVHIRDLGPLFTKDQNVRDAELGYDTVNFCNKLATDGRVFEAVHVCMEGTPEEFMKNNTYDKIVASFKDLEPLKGFRRANCSLIVFENPDKYIGEFDPFIGVVFKFGMSRAERLHYKLDHSQNKGLNDYELGLCIRQEIQSGVARTNKEIVCEHQSLFQAATSAKGRSALEHKLAERPKLADPVKDFAARQDIIFNFFKGRFQELQRIFTGPNSKVLMENYRRKIYGIKDELVVRYTQKELNEIWSEKDPVEFEKKWSALIKAQEDAGLEAAKPNYKWTKKTFEEKRDIFGVVRWLGTTLDAVNGDLQAQQKLTKVRDELMLIQKKMDEDPEVFWKFIK